MEESVVTKREKLSGMPLLSRSLLLFFASCALRGFVLADVVVFADGTRLEVRDLVIGEVSATYTLDGMRLETPLKYLDIGRTTHASSAGGEKQDVRGGDRPARLPGLRSKKPVGSAVAAPVERRVTTGDLKSFKPRDGAVEAPEQVSIPFVRRDGLIILDALINGKFREEFVFDTGASVSTITKKAAHRAGIRLDGAPVVTVSTAAGDVMALMVELDSLDFAGVRVRNCPVLVMQGSPVNLVGQNLLSNFLVTVDYEKRQILLKIR